MPGGMVILRAPLHSEVAARLTELQKHVEYGARLGTETEIMVSQEWCAYPDFIIYGHDGRGYKVFGHIEILLGISGHYTGFSHFCVKADGTAHACGVPDYDLARLLPLVQRYYDSWRMPAASQGTSHPADELVQWVRLLIRIQPRLSLRLGDE